MGIEPSELGVKTHVFGVWRYQCYSFFAVLFPFFFARGFCCCIQGLVGDETYESKFRSRGTGKRTSPKTETTNRDTREMSTMRLQRFMERWASRRTLRNGTTLLLQRMHLSILNLVTSKKHFFILGARRLHS